MSSDRNGSSTTRRRRGWKMDGEGTDVGVVTVMKGACAK